MKLQDANLYLLVRPIGSWAGCIGNPKLKACGVGINPWPRGKALALWLIISSSYIDVEGVDP